MANGLPREFGKYELIELLGEGGMARVYRAVLSGPGGFRKQVAVKQMRPHVGRDERMVRFLINEARLGGHLRHPNVVEVYEFGQVDDTHYLAIEFVDGPTLSQVMERVSRQGALPPRMAASICMQICLGLHYAHTAKDDQGQPMQLVHRDLKPSNVLLRRDGVVKLADFGVARAATNITKTTTGMTRGTPQYMSPEQVTGEKHGQLDGRSDLFSLTSILAEMITGQTVFEDPNLLDLLNKIARVEVGETLEKIAEIAPALQSVLRKGFQEWPEHRHESALEMGRDLRRCYDRLPEIGEERIGPWLAAWMGDAEPAVDPAVTEESLLGDESLGLPFEEATEDSYDAPDPTRESMPTTGDSLDPESAEDARPWGEQGLASQDESLADDTQEDVDTVLQQSTDGPGEEPADLLGGETGSEGFDTGKTAWTQFLSQDESEEAATPSRPVGKVGDPIFETVTNQPTLEEERRAARDGDVGRTFTLVVVGGVTTGLLALAAFVYRVPLGELLGMEAADPEIEATFQTPEPDDSGTTAEGRAPARTTPISAPAVGAPGTEPQEEVEPTPDPVEENVVKNLSRRPKIRRCFRIHTKKHGTAETVTVSYVVAPNGKISGTQVVSPEGLDSEFSACLCNAMDHLKLDPTGADEALERVYTFDPPDKL